MEKIKRILIISSDKGLRDVLNFCFDGWGYEVFLQDTPAGDINVIKRISPDVIVVDVQAAKKPQLHICQLLKDDFTTAFIPIITIINKRQLRQQLLEIRQGVDDYLIKPPDPLDLRIRIEMAIKRSQFSFYTNPLTGLPGARAIEDSLNAKIEQGSFFSFGYVDIDNFKYYNDVYGYLKGDRVIMQTAYMLYSAIKNSGSPGDTIGHIGGDDFVFITTSDKYKDVCGNFIETFDRIIPFHYSEEDRKQRFVIAKDRTKKIRKIPLMSLSVAVVNRTNLQEFKSMLEINDRVTEIKRYLKSIPDSKYMADRRTPESDPSAGPQGHERKTRNFEDYKPLGQVLLNKKIISLEQLDEALKINWKRGMPLGEILKELGFVSEEELASALDSLKSPHSASKPT
ncbi:MAG: diguanylate cyclase [Candidatus Omnitrophica bacterium]|nr:diguanylate cyclase [Candidatus Omnitrophota bacterium]